MSFILLRVKFTPRWDTPSDPGRTNLKITVDPNYLKVEALGLNTYVPILYNLTIDRLYMAFSGYHRWTHDA